MWWELISTEMVQTYLQGAQLSELTSERISVWRKNSLNRYAPCKTEVLRKFRVSAWITGNFKQILSINCTLWKSVHLREVCCLQYQHKDIYHFLIHTKVTFPKSPKKILNCVNIHNTVTNPPHAGVCNWTIQQHHDSKIPAHHNQWDFRSWF